MTVAMVFGLGGAMQVAAGDLVRVELNKVEAAQGGGCSTYFLFRNSFSEAFKVLEMSLAVMDKAGVINQLLTINAAPIPAERTTLKLFDIPDIDCGQISEILVHDIPACEAENTEAMACYSVVGLDSKAAIGLIK